MTSPSSFSLSDNIEHKLSIGFIPGELADHSPIFQKWGKLFIQHSWGVLAAFLGALTRMNKKSDLFSNIHLFIILLVEEERLTAFRQVTLKILLQVTRRICRLLLWDFVQVWMCTMWHHAPCHDSSRKFHFKNWVISLHFLLYIQSFCWLGVENTSAGDFPDQRLFRQSSTLQSLWQQANTSMLALIISAFWKIKYFTIDSKIHIEQFR